MAAVTDNNLQEMILDLQNRLTHYEQTDADARATAQLGQTLYGRLIKHFNDSLDPAAIRLGEPWMFESLGLQIERYRIEQDELAKKDVTVFLTIGDAKEQ